MRTKIRKCLRCLRPPRATGATPREERRNLALTNTSTSSLQDVARAVLGAEVVALDLETTGLDPRRAEIRLIQISTGEKTFVIDCRAHDKEDLQRLAQTLSSTPVVAHGATFEWMFLYYHFGVELMN